jgi:hypothetical protein
MNQNDRGTLKKLWDMRNLSVDEFLQKISIHPDLKFLLTTVGAWFLLRWIIGIWIGAHVIYFIYRIFNLVLG